MSKKKIKTDDQKFEEVLTRLDKKHLNDYYAIEWPIVSREWTFGTYVNEVLQHFDFDSKNKKGKT